MYNLIEEIKDVTVDTAAYAAGDLLCEKIEIKVGTGGNLLLNKVVVIDLAKQNANLNFIFFDSNPASTTFTENSALTIADADLDKITGIVTVEATDYEDFADNSCACVFFDNILLHVKETALYCAVEVGGSSAPDYVAAGDVRLRFGLLK